MSAFLLGIDNGRTGTWGCVYRNIQDFGNNDVWTTSWSIWSVRSKTSKTFNGVGPDKFSQWWLKLLETHQIEFREDDEKIAVVEYPVRGARLGKAALAGHFWHGSLLAVLEAHGFRIATIVSERWKRSLFGKPKADKNECVRYLLQNTQHSIAARIKAWTEQRTHKGDSPDGLLLAFYALRNPQEFGVASWE